MKQVKMMLAVLLGLCVLTGCSMEKTSQEKQADLEYTLVAGEDIPQELLTQIEDAKEEEMKLTYSDGGCFYLVKGYGEQPAGSSIQVLDLYQTKDGIVFDTQLLGGGETKVEDTTSAYPYIVVKLLCDEQNVVFQ